MKTELLKMTNINKKHAHSNATHYAGQFHTYADKQIFIIDGFGG